MTTTPPRVRLPGVGDRSLLHPPGTEDVVDLDPATGLLRLVIRTGAYAPDAATYEEVRVITARAGAEAEAGGHPDDSGVGEPRGGQVPTGLPDPGESGPGRSPGSSSGP